MLRFNLSNQDKCPNFIGAWIIEHQSICDELIAYFEINKKKQSQGITVEGRKGLELKNSIDISVSPKELLLQ